MALTKGGQILKYLVFIFNLFFWLSGLVLIIIGAIAKTNNFNLQHYVGSGANGAPILLIVVGCIITVLGFFGCFGAIRENFCMLITFSALLGLIFICELAAGIASYALHDKVEAYIITGMKNEIKNKNSTGIETETTLEKLQRQFHCCGISNFTDWKDSPFYGSRNRVPETCCRPITTNHTKCITEVDWSGKKPDETIWSHGCQMQFFHKIQKNVAMIAGVGVGIAFLQALGIALACCLAHSIRRGAYETV